MLRSSHDACGCSTQTTSTINLKRSTLHTHEGQSTELLRKAMSIDPNNADITHSLGLALVRQHNYAEALPELRRASELAPSNARYAYVYAIALNSIGSQGEAMELLETTHKRHPADRDTLLALLSIAQESGDFATALTHARELVTLYGRNRPAALFTTTALAREKFARNYGRATLPAIC
jgi:Flp pilus assembly protein TadD